MNRLRSLVALLLGITLLTACRVSTPTPTGPEPATEPATTTPSPRAVVPTPQPTQDAGAAVGTAVPAMATPGQAAFALTILHTGQVHGEVLPCG